MTNRVTCRSDSVWFGGSISPEIIGEINQCGVKYPKKCSGNWNFWKIDFLKKIKRRKFWLSTLKYSQSTNFGSFGAITLRLMGFSPQILFHCNLFNTWNKVKCYFDITNEQFQDFLKIFLFYWQKKHDIAMKSVKTEFIEVHRVVCDRWSFLASSQFLASGHFWPLIIQKYNFWSVNGIGNIFGFGGNMVLIFCISSNNSPADDLRFPLDSLNSILKNFYRGSCISSIYL